jgi:hypothetical protein
MNEVVATVSVDELADGNHDAIATSSEHLLVRARDQRTPA